MKTFTDSAGRTWTIHITVDAIKRVQNLVGINLADITAPAPGSPGSDTPLLTRLEVDLVLLCDVVYALIKPQADQADVTDEQFGQALGGDAILGARDAFWESLSDFFHQLRRPDQVRAIAKQTALVQAAVAAADQKIEALDPAQMVDQAMLDGEPKPRWADGGATLKGGDSSGNSPASSPSIPGR